MSQEMKRGVKMLEVHVNMMGRAGVLHPTLIVDGENVILVDTGLPGQLGTIREALQQQTGIPFERINQVILTHHDIDHLGGLRELLKRSFENATAPVNQTVQDGDELPTAAGSLSSLRPAIRWDICRSMSKRPKP